MIRYKIGDEYLDQYNDTKDFAITKAVSKVGEINLRHGDRSTGFKVPLTAKNTKLLNYTTVLSSATTDKSFKKIFGKIIDNDTVISEGYYQVIKYDPLKKEVDLRFYGGNTDWFSELKDRKINQNYLENNPYSINDLDLYYDPLSIKTNIEGVISETEPYKFFLVDNNKDSTRNKDNDVTLETYVDDYQVGFSQGYLFDRIFKSQNIKLEGNLFSDTLYYNTLVSASYNPFNSEELQANNTFRFTIPNPPNERPLEQFLPYVPNAPFTDKDTLSFDGGNPRDEFDGVSFTFLGTGQNVEFTNRLNIKVTPTTGTTYLVRFDVYKNNVLEAVDQVAVMSGSGAFQYADCSYNFANVVDGDTIRFEFNHDFPPLSGFSVVYGSFLNVYVENYTKKTLAKNLLPNISQSDFVKDVLVQFGVITQYDQRTRTLKCNKFNIIEDNKLYSKDWSSKIDLSNTPIVDVTKLVQKYSKRSYFRYSDNDDSDSLSSLYKSINNYNYGTGVLLIDNAFLDDESDFYESPYSPTQMVETFPRQDPDNLLNPSFQLGNMFLPYVPIYTLSSVDDQGNISYDDNDLNPRKYIYTDNVSIDTAYRGNVTSINISGNNITELPLVYFDKSFYTFESSEINTFSKVASFGVLNDLNNSTGSQNDIDRDTIIDEYYQFQNKVLNKPIYLEIYLKLTPLDVQSVDFFTPIWLNFGLDSGNYYIDEISQYQGSNKSTKVKLVKI